MRHVIKMLLLKRSFSRFIPPVRKSARKKFHKNLVQHSKDTVPNENISGNKNNVVTPNTNDKVISGGRGLLSTFYESFIYGCGFFLSNRMLDQIFGPRTYDTVTNDTEHHTNDNTMSSTDNNMNNYNNENYNYNNEGFLNNDSNINDDDFQQDIGLDDDTFEF